MPREIHILSDIQLRKWLRAGEPLAKSDGDGLTFTLSENGMAAWILRFRHGGRRHELTLGRYPDMTLTGARKEATKRRLEVQQGVNPATEKRKAKARKEWTVRELASDYRELVLAGLAENTRRGYERNLKRIEAGMGSLLVRDVEAADVVAMLERHELGWVEANTLLIVQKAIFRHAAGKKLINVNPCLGVELSALLGKRPEVRKRLMLSEAELRTVLNADMSKDNLLAVRILAATGVRVSELYTARWDHIDLEDACWHIPKSKTGPEMDIPLAPVVVDWFRDLRVLALESAYVLPARAQRRIIAGGGDAHISKDCIREAIDFWLETYKPEVRRFTPHDLRSTMKSHMRALGVSRDISEMCLNHKLPGVEGVYDVHSYYAERRAALDLWAAFLTTCQAGTTWNVTPLKKGAA
ncbi:tyrosine-type recombinase/integrase [Cupriavidus taiwanensis]|uniref:Putative phage integrase n=1 Tax=Cupriavidus taiwanensis TaxID=164546 RepID=A0A375J296_9BURK|nr:site-specific integrase [Cupriavidus taiwanensis]SPR99318.1 putative phage integrase [Cupriavidus taiwanensis]